MKLQIKIQISNVSVTYDSIEALKGVTISMEGGKVYSLVGPNGSGKTTLLRCIDCIVRPKVGAVFLDGRDISKFSTRELAKTIGYVPQTQVAYHPLTAFKTVLMGRRPYVSWSLGEKDVEIARKALKVVGAEHLANRYYDELSGGEKQKVMIARALAQEPKVLLLDEPTSNLDLRHQLEILYLLRQLAEKDGLLIVMAMHDINLACRFSDFIIMLKDGKIFAVGKPDEAVTPENVRRVYGVDVAIFGNPRVIVPLGIAEGVESEGSEL